MSVGDDELAQIGVVLANGDAAGAYARLRARVGWPRGKALPIAAWIELLAALAERTGAVPIADLARAVVRDPDNPDGLYELGYALIDEHAAPIGATVLWRCMELVGDSEQVVSELVSALESTLAHEDAFALLDARAALRAESAICQYLYAFDAAMIGRLDVTRRAFAELRVHLAAHDAGGDHAALERALAAILARADRVAAACPLDAADLRGWHYVLNGCLLVHQSPYGWPAPMRGRYAWLRDSIDRVAMGIERLRALAAATGAPCVYSSPRRDDEIIARAVALRLELPLVPWPAVGVPAPGIVALYDLGAAADTDKLVDRRPGQIVFAHATPWTRDCPIAADVTTLLYEVLEPPWHADDRPAAVIAAELAASSGVSSEDLAADEPERWAALVAAAWPPPDGPRSRAWAGGPVRSNRFG